LLIIPAIDLRNGQCVRLTQGRRDSVTSYDGNPVEIARAFQGAGAQILHIVDLDGAFSENKDRNREVLKDVIRAIDIPVQFGGGMRTIQDVEEVLSLGVTRVVVGTVAAESPDTLTEMVQLFSPSAIVVGIDARDGQVVTHGWETREQLDALTLARRVAGLGVERIVYTDVQRDGTLVGVNIEQTCLIAQVSRVKITASGGVSSLDDISKLAAIKERGVDSVIVGKALYEGRFTFEQAQRAAS
jgi:phosphoribosylformimino-5-aminoimidazole carboxamide ribotide isomerase